MNEPILYKCNIAVYRQCVDPHYNDGEYITDWVVETPDTLAEYEKIVDDIETNQVWNTAFITREYERIN